VQVVTTVGEEAAVTGIQVGDRVVLEGRQNVRPGAAVVERAPEGRRRPGAVAGDLPAASAARTARPVGAASGAAP
jgi:hypothetical protein